MEEIVQGGPGNLAVSIRAMQSADLERVLAIAVELPPAPQWPRQAYVELLDPASGLLRIALVAEAGDTIVGFTVLRVLAPEAELESIAVAEEAQRSGIGGLLLEAAIRELRDLGVERILLEVRVSNRAAAALYGRLGFRESGRRAHYYAAPVEDAVLMELGLR